MRQGDNLSPLLFSLFINDFETHLSRSHIHNSLNSLTNLFSDATLDDDLEIFLKLYILLYADDTIFMTESEINLQEALKDVSDYCDKWLRINVSKTTIIRFTKRKSPRNPANVYTFWIKEEKVEVVDDI